MFVEAGVLDPRHAPLERPPKRVVGRACCRGAYLRGALLGGGSLSGPRSPHLELRTTSLDGAEFLRSVAAASDVTLSVLDRGRHAAAYAKGFDAIEAVLSAAGAGDAVLAFEERSIVAAARGEANRLANADHANLVRTSRAAQEQLEAVRALQATGALERLPDRLYEVARLRLRHPTLPLRELAAKCDPPSTKASVHRRFKKLGELVSNL
jgi:DNA-binding protein WhiA